MEKLAESDREYLKVYASMLKSLEINPEYGNSLIKRLATRVDTSIGSHFSTGSKMKFYDSGKTNCYVTVSGNLKTIGTILTATHQLHDLLGYAPSLVKGININNIMPNYIKVKHDRILTDYFNKTTKSTGISGNVIIYPLNAEGHMRIGYGRVKILPDLNQGILLFCVFWLIEVEEMIENYSEDEEKLEFITYLAETGEVLGISKGIESEYGVSPVLFTEANPNTKPIITDLLPGLKQNKILDLSRQVFVPSVLDSTLMES